MAFPSCSVSYRSSPPTPTSPPLFLPSSHLYQLRQHTDDSGADDDGSGTTSSLEALSALAAGNFTPANPVEFHYYSAEEGGLLGSQAVAKAYEDDKVKVKAMLQMDMTAWVKAGTKESIGIIQDFVDPALTAFVEDLVNEYRASLVHSYEKGC